MFCSECGKPLVGVNPTFCHECGNRVASPVDSSGPHDDGGSLAVRLGGGLQTPDASESEESSQTPAPDPSEDVRAAAVSGPTLDFEAGMAASALPLRERPPVANGAAVKPSSRRKWVVLGVVVAASVVGVVMITTRSAPAAMPDVVGESLHLAYTQLDSAGVGKGDVEIVGGGFFPEDYYRDWVVCFQTPDAGDTIESVQLVIDPICANLAQPDSGSTTDAGTSVTSAAAPDTTSGSFAMPSVVGMVLQDAQDLLQSNGSYLMDQVDATGQGRFQMLDSNWMVCSQSPAAGAILDGSTAVTLSAVKLDEACP